MLSPGPGLPPQSIAGVARHWHVVFGNGPWHTPASQHFVPPRTHGRPKGTHCGSWAVCTTDRIDDGSAQSPTMILAAMASVLNANARTNITPLGNLYLTADTFSLSIE